eukprot:GDKI01005747.1.p1 GENE.GDKI01005747.1~~GDKI01005747.1.p1  ORF type:complete len:288 (-),score=91.55 GDKI01005747.1:853-1716(-)
MSESAAEQFPHDVCYVLQGDMYDSTEFGCVRVLKQCVLGVSHAGKISLLETCPSKTPKIIEHYTHTLGAHKILTLAHHQFLTPGFVDTHIHAPQYTYTGTATDKPLMEWLQAYTFPEEMRYSDPAYASKMYPRVVTRTLKCGTTTALYFGTNSTPGCEELCKVCERLGQRAIVGKVCMDRFSPDGYKETADQALQSMRIFVDFCLDNQKKETHVLAHVNEKDVREQVKGDGDVHTLFSAPVCAPCTLPAITPRFIPTCTDELLSGLGKLAQEKNCHITSRRDRLAHD